MAHRISQVRERRGLTQAEAAERLGIALRNWQRIESGQNLTLHSLVKIAQALECTVHELVCENPVTSPLSTKRAAPRTRR